MPGVVDEAEARRISKAIDQELQRERDLIKRRQGQRKDVKVMLLGQAESGKSTLQKQFQLYYASSTIDRERPSWRPIVYFNVIKAVRTVLEELDYDFNNDLPPTDDDESDFLDPEWPYEIATLATKLLPLTSLEDSLASELSGGVTVSGGRTGVYVRAGWQALVTPTRSWPLSDIRNSISSTRTSTVANLAARQLAETQYEIAELWQHPATKALLRTRKLRLEESAALCTLGVTEHIFEIDFGTAHYNWLLYDVGGARHAWVPYFDDGITPPIADNDAVFVHFRVVVSRAYPWSQYLEEDPRTNRIDDSLQLFTAICTNKLLKNSTLVLMLNKTDILRKKLQAGVEVKKYITSYGERPNRYEDVSEYFRAHFAQVHKRKGQSKQQLYTHFTSMLDIRATQKIIVDVNEAIIRSYLGNSGLA
ncbi:G-protein alpha subunit [Artomyces pyxidatus]|uniref:G-protein alpha subunit n=1 Tax=Artomyces pyxidatus TaxID=48021 RepID=A0ACB8TD50_9AGAM|nr:G-protein alpha subunit [Artomyces pyxidatus]